jgi:hypothetical protein
MKSKLLLMVFILLVFLSSCIKSQDNLDSNLGKDAALEAISEFKDTLISLKLDENNLSNQSMITLLSDEDPLYPKEDLSSLSDYNQGHINQEWVEMSILILDFSKAILETDYVLGEETRVYDLREDITWGWILDETTKVIIQYEGEVLHLKVINFYSWLTASTFIFQYNEEGLIEILRIEETYSQEQPNLYVEYFIENTGISMGSLNGYSVYVSMQLDEGVSYNVYQRSNEEETEIYFISAQYEFENLDLIISKQNNQYVVKYDLYKYPVFDHFSENGELYLDGQLVNLEEEIIFKNYGSKNYLYVEDIIEDNDLNLSRSSLGFETSLTTTEIINGFQSITLEQINQAMKFPYHNPDELFISLESYLYFDYSNENNRTVSFYTEGGTIIPVQIVEKGSVFTLDLVAERNDSVFLGWSYTYNGDIITDESIIIMHDTFLYANYELINPKTITYYDQNLNIIYSIHVVEDTYSISVDHTVTGYTFLGWATSFDGEPIYQLYDVISVGTDVSLYGIYIPNE